MIQHCIFYQSYVFPANYHCTPIVKPVYVRAFQLEYPLGSSFFFRGATVTRSSQSSCGGSKVNQAKSAFLKSLIHRHPNLIKSSEIATKSPAYPKRNMNISSSQFVLQGRLCMRYFHANGSISWRTCTRKISLCILLSISAIITSRY